MAWTTGEIERLQLLVGILLLYSLVFSATDVSGFTSRPAQWRLALYLGMILLQCLPLVVVIPIGPRYFRGTYLLTVLMLKEFWDEYHSLAVERGKFTYRKPATSLLAVVLAIDLFCYVLIGIAHHQKIEYIRSEAENGNKTVEVSYTPLRFMVYGLDVEDKSPKYLQRFCEYYQLPPDIELHYR